MEIKLRLGYLLKTKFDKSAWYFEPLKQVFNMFSSSWILAFWLEKVFKSVLWQPFLAWGGFDKVSILGLPRILESSISGLYASSSSY